MDHDRAFLWLLDATHSMVLTADDDRYVENFSTDTAVTKITGRTAYHEDVRFATPLERTELGDLILQYREETRQQRKELALSHDDGSVRCIDWDGPRSRWKKGASSHLLGGECWESVRLWIDALNMTRMLTPSSELRGRTRR